MSGVSLRCAFAAVIPFALVALAQFYRSTLLSGISPHTDRIRRVTKVHVGPAPFDGKLGAAAANITAQLRSRASASRAAADARSSASAGPAATGDRSSASTGPTAADAAAPIAPIAGAHDHAVDYPPPTLSSKRLLDGTANWLPVPSAEAEHPDDLKWRDAIVPNSTRCPPGRRPFHTILTAQKSLYQEWQTKIFYHHFRKAQAAGGPCTEMTGFTRLLAGNADDALSALMPTVRIPEADRGKTRGFQVINRPWTLAEWVKQPDFAARFREEYVYIAETDHLLLKDIPNRATPQLSVAFFFPYMSPVPTPQRNVVKRYFEGDPLSVQPVGGSPAIMHVATLRRVAPVWLELSVALKADREADRTFGWVLEMWGYSIACARLGVKHFVWQRLQIEPAAAWHQEVSAQDPYIYHYTFGVEYSLEGVPKVGGVGEWSLDKRKYYGRAPPLQLTQPPQCAQECAWRWWSMFNEATAALAARGQWYASVGSDTLQRPDGIRSRTLTPLARGIVHAGPWLFAEGSELLFYRRGIAYSRWGGGSWQQKDALTITLTLCSALTLTFDHPTAPTSFTYSGKAGKLAPERAAAMRAPEWEHAQSATVQRLLGEGPWHFRDQQALAFLWGGVLSSPWGYGSWAPVNGSDDVALTVQGEPYRLTMTGCYTFVAVKQGTTAKLKGWIPVRHVSMEYTHWRDSNGCKY